MIAKIKKRNLNKNLWSRNGFTLIETLLYLVIVATILGIIAAFFFLMHSIEIKSEIVNEVEYQGSYAMENILYSIRNSEGIVSPGTALSSGTLVLDAYDTNNDPTIIELENNKIKITEGGNPSNFLTSNLVAVSGLSFQNLSYSLTPGIIKVEFTVSYINNSGRNEYDYQKTFYGSASLR